MPADWRRVSYFSRTVRMHFDVLLCRSTEDLFFVIRIRSSSLISLPLKSSRRELQVAPLSLSQSPDLKPFIHMVGPLSLLLQLSPLFHQDALQNFKGLVGIEPSCLLMGDCRPAVAGKDQYQRPLIPSFTLRTPRSNGRAPAHPGARDSVISRNRRVREPCSGRLEWGLFLCTK